MSTHTPRPWNGPVEGSARASGRGAASPLPRGHASVASTRPASTNTAATATSLEGKERTAMSPQRSHGSRGRVPAPYHARVMDLGLSDAVAIVTASSKGLGLGTAKALSAEGAKVV